MKQNGKYILDLLRKGKLNDHEKVYLKLWSFNRKCDHRPQIKWFRDQIKNKINE
jgi:hypothetical protein